MKKSDSCSISKFSSGQWRSAWSNQVQCIQVLKRRKKRKRNKLCHCYLNKDCINNNKKAYIYSYNNLKYNTRAAQKSVMTFNILVKFTVTISLLFNLCVFPVTSIINGKSTDYQGEFLYQYH